MVACARLSQAPFEFQADQKHVEDDAELRDDVQKRRHRREEDHGRQLRRDVSQ